jgi:RNA polymerase sigma-70 factor (ECF subfamily)
MTVAEVVDEVKIEQNDFATSEDIQTVWVALYSLIERYNGIFYNSAFKILKRAELAEEVLSQAMTNAFEQRDKYNSEKPFKYWYNTVVKNTALNLYGREILQVPETSFKAECEEGMGIVEFLGCDDSPGPLELACSAEEMEELNAAMNYLEIKKPNQIIPLRMHLNGLEYKEIASQLNIPIGTVMSRIHNARQALIEEMKGILEVV